MLGAKETLMLLDVLRPTAIVVIRWINAVRMHLHSDAIMIKSALDSWIVFAQTNDSR